MKSLTLTQPWATLVVRGIKRFETRSWAYRLPWERQPELMTREQLDAAYIVGPSTPGPNGTATHTIRPRPIPLAIHAAKGQDRDARDFADYLVRSGVLEFADLPRGAIVGMVTFMGCHWSYAETRAELAPSDLELELGDWSDGRVLWELAEPREFDEPIPRQGSLGLWNWRAPDYLGLEAAIAAKDAR